MLVVNQSLGDTVTANDSTGGAGGDERFVQRSLNVHRNKGGTIDCIRTRGLRVHVLWSFRDERYVEKCWLAVQPTLNAIVPSTSANAVERSVTNNRQDVVKWWQRCNLELHGTKSRERFQQCMSKAK